MANKQIKVLYIAGSGRSGSTILGSVLGQVEKFFHTGELYSLWDVSLSNEKICGCGRVLQECPLWASVLQNVFEERQIDVDRMVQLQRKTVRTHEVPLYAYLLRRSSQQVAPQTYLDGTERLYRAIQDVTQCDWIVDSSKIPAHAYLLSTIPSVDLRILHLVRDVRAITYSWQRRAVDGFRPGTRRTVSSWMVRNLVTEMFGRTHPSRYLRLHYEEFATRPLDAVRRVLRYIGAEGNSLPFLSDRKVQLDATHTAWGNPGRHRTGLVEIALDEEWKSSLAATTNIGVTALTWPLLLRYGYLGPQKLFGKRATSF